MVNDKQSIREAALVRRKMRHGAYGPGDAHALADRFMDTYLTSGLVSDQVMAAGGALCLAGYQASDSEIDLAPLMRALHATGYDLCLPYCPKRDMAAQFRKFQPGDTLHKDAYGMAAPHTTAPLCHPQIVLVPMLAFDARANRLGRGAGIYDRTLAALRAQDAVVAPALTPVLTPVIAIGLAYDVQLVDKCPTGSHDENLDVVITPQKTYFRNGSAQ